MATKKTDPVIERLVEVLDKTAGVLDRLCARMDAAPIQQTESTHAARPAAAAENGGTTTPAAAGRAA